MTSEAARDDRKATRCKRLLALMDEASYLSAAEAGRDLARDYPGDAHIQILAAQSQLLNRDPRCANQYSTEALRLDERSVPAIVVQSRVLLALQRLDEAESMLESALALSTDNARLLQEKGDLLAAIGKLDTARDCYIQSLDIDSRNMTSLLNLAQLDASAITRSMAKKASFLVSSGQLSPDEQAKSHFALARYCEAHGDFSGTMRHLSLGNAEIAKKYPYSADTEIEAVQATLDFFSTERLASCGELAVCEDKLIFIVGMPRSGSTLIEQTLAMHTDIRPAGETGFLVNSLQDFAREYEASEPFPAFLGTVGAKCWGRIGERYMQRTAHLSDRGVITDKTLANYFYIGLLYLLFPNARIIESRRHPIATCYSCYKHLFTPGNVRYSYDLQHLVSAYLNYAKAMRHWKEALPGVIHTVDYEDLVTDQASVVRRLLSHCELSWQDACLDFHNARGGVMTSSVAQVRKPLYTDALSSWQDYARDLEEFAPLREIEHVLS